MIESMTGFGRGSAPHPQQPAQLNLEITSLNRKGADFSFQLPRELQTHEKSLRTRLSEVVSRGRVQVSVTLQSTGEALSNQLLCPQRAQELEDAFAQLSTQLGRPIQPQAQDFLAHAAPDLTPPTPHPAEWEAPLHQAFAQALEELHTMRQREGRELSTDLSQRLQTLESELHAIEKRRQPNLDERRQRLHTHLVESGLDALDPHDERLLKEVLLHAERVDISEEITRLHAHLTQFREALQSTTPVGRRLDFLCQEMSREYHTISSKSLDPTISQHTVTSRAELEKIREQVQNVQ